jgi:ribosomal protein S4
MTSEPPAGETLLHVTAAPAQAGERLDRLLASHLHALSRTRLKRLIEDGRVSAGGATVTDPSMRVKPGQVFALTCRRRSPTGRRRRRSTSSSASRTSISWSSTSRPGSSSIPPPAIPTGPW